MRQTLLLIVAVAMVGCGKEEAGNTGVVESTLISSPQEPASISPPQEPSATNLRAPSAKFLETKTKAQAGDATAQSELGEMYGRGEEVEQSIKKAVKWFRLAADQGDEEARKNLQALLKEHSELREN